MRHCSGLSHCHRKYFDSCLSQVLGIINISPGQVACLISLSNFPKRLNLVITTLEFCFANHGVYNIAVHCNEPEQDD